MDRRNLLLNEMGITRLAALYAQKLLQGAVGVSVFRTSEIYCSGQ